MKTNKCDDIDVFYIIGAVIIQLVYKFSFTSYLYSNDLIK